jgi:hypothetical protein
VAVATIPLQGAAARTSGACPAGTQAEGAAAVNGGGVGYPGLAGEPGKCLPLGGVESPADRAVMARQQAAPWTAGSGPIPPGAQAAALAARQQMAAATGATSWKPVGRAPLSAGAQFDAVGSPFPQYINALGLRNLTGRITDLQYDPAVPGRLFASAAEGGVWESRNGGASWTSIGDNLITQSVGAIAWDPVGGGTIIVGTGDNAQGRYNYGGHGLYFSHDEGRTWIKASPNVEDDTENFRIAVSGIDNHRIYVANSRGLYQGTFSADGSSLALTNVRLPTGKNPAVTGPDCGTAAGADVFPNCFLDNNVTDVQVRAPGGFQGSSAQARASVSGDEVIATVGSRFGSHFYASPDGSTSLGFTQTPGAGIYRSMVGGPGTYTHLAATGYPTSAHSGRVSLNSAKGANQNHAIVYALVQDPKKEDSCFDDFDVPSVCQKPLPTPIVPTPGANLSTVLDGLYYSSDFGDNWTKVMDWSQLDQPGTNSAIGGPGGQDAVGYGPGIQSSYNNWVMIDPTRADSSGKPTRLLFGLEEIWENNPSFLSPFGNPATTPFLEQKPVEGAGVNDPWVVIGRYWNSCGPFTFGEGFNCNGAQDTIGGTTTHPDQHAALFVPLGASGVTFYAGNDGGLFSQASDAGHPEFDNQHWGLGISNNMNVLQPYDAEISRDGTIAAGLQDNGEMKINPDGSMVEIYGGDGLFSAIDPNNSKNIVESYVYGRTAFTEDGGVNWTLRDPGLSSGCTGCARFDTPFQQDPSNAKHFLIAGRQVYNRPWGYGNPDCIPATPADPNCLIVTNANEWDKVYDLGTRLHPGDANQSTTPSAPDANNSSTAVDVHENSEYVGFCAQCDLILEGNPFGNGIATNVGGAGAKFDDPAGWHMASLRCSNCKTQAGGPMNRIPRRLITSVRIDPHNDSTIYVTMGGYQRVWIKPGAFGEANPFIGRGHVFKSVNHGEDFTDITGNLPDTPALFSLVHNGQLVVATDIGVFQSTDTNGGAYSVLGANLPATPVDTIRLAPGNSDLMIAALWGRGVWSYCFSGASCPVNIAPASTPAVMNELPPTAARLVAGPGLPLLILGVVALVVAGRRRPAPKRAG